MADDGQILADTVARFTFWANERIKSTFKDDAYKAIVDRLGERAAIQRSAPVDNTLAEFPADAIVRPASPAGTPAPVTAVFFVQSLDTLNEALVLWTEARQRHRPVRIAALVEDTSSLRAPLGARQSRKPPYPGASK